MSNSDISNPFDFIGALDLPHERLTKFFVQNSAHKAVLESPRNVFVLGNRGSGKSMTLLYFSLRRVLASQEQEPNSDIDRCGVYIPCNTTIHLKNEHLALSEDKRAAVSEHYLVLNTLYHLAEELLELQERWTQEERAQLRGEFAYIFRAKPPNNRHPLYWLLLYAERLATEVQGRDYTKQASGFLLTFNTAVLPVLRGLNRTLLHRRTVFSLLYDDANVIDNDGQRTLNSWIAFRGYSKVNFKVAIAKASEYIWETRTKGPILLGHDYAQIDLEEPFQSKQSEYYDWARNVIATRLRSIGIERDPIEYFPENKSVSRAIEACKKLVREQKLAERPEIDQASLADYVYKHGRAEFFKRRTKANRPQYSGFDVLVAFSTGIIRNLLQPCYAAFNYAAAKGGVGSSFPTVVSPQTQDKAVKVLSDELWDELGRIEKKIVGCSKEDGVKLRHFFECLARLLEHRLKHHKSEPRTLGFTLSEQDTSTRQEIERILGLAMEAQLLYVRPYAGKDAGKYDTLYMPNRLLWARHGLDPMGQHGRVTLKLSEVTAAMKGRDFSQVGSTKATGEDLFDV